MHRVFCAYFDGFQGVGEMSRFLWWTQYKFLLTCNGVEVIETQLVFWRILKEKNLYGAQEWNVNWINKTGGGK